jgi:hypothetical protein
MRIVVVHDSKGQIKSLSIPSNQFPGQGIKPPSDHYVSVVELPSVHHAGHLTQYLRGHRLEKHGDHSKLVKK